MIRAEPENEFYQMELAFTTFGLGVLYCMSAPTRQAERTLLQARDLYRNLVQKQPHETERLSGLAKTLNSLGILYSDLGRTNEAEKAFQEAVTLKERLAGEHPAVTRFQEDLSTSYNSLGILYYHSQHHEEA